MDENKQNAKPSKAVKTVMLADIGGVPTAIDIEADEKIVQAVIGRDVDQELVTGYFKMMAEQNLQMHRALGLSSSGIKRIFFSTELPEGASALWTVNDKIFGQLHSYLMGWTCVESEACKCSYCVPRDFPEWKQG